MLRTRGEILALLGRTLLILPLTLAAWYYASPALDHVAARIAKPLVTLVSGGKVESIAVVEGEIRYDFNILAPYRMGEAQAPPADVDLEMNGKVYTFGIALFLALSLALKASRRAGRILIGCAILVVLPAWGIGFDALRQLGSAADLAPYLEWGGGVREGVAVGYQLGSLLFPSLAPIAAWLALNPKLMGSDSI